MNERGVDDSRRKAVLMFLKYPEPGKVKTRLAASVGTERAVEIYRQLVGAVCAVLPRDAELIAIFDPPERCLEMERWLREIGVAARLQPQAGGDLGRRLEQAFAAAFRDGFDSVAVIGSDCIELNAAHFAEVWQALETHDCAIGPTMDGGYYLLALRRPSAEIFSEIDWSTDTVFAQTLDRARDAGLRVHVLPRLHDVDTEADWLRAEQQLRELKVAHCDQRL